MKKNPAKIQLLLVILLVCGLLFAACNNQPAIPDSLLDMQLSVECDGKEVCFTLHDILAIADSKQEGIYSTINNWPSKRFNAAKGIKVSTVLDYTDLHKNMTAITFIGADGYQTTFTKEQFEAERFYFPGLMEDSEEGAVPVEIILAYGTKEDTKDMELLDSYNNSLTLHFGQVNVFEQTSVAFVENVNKIIIHTEEPEKWANASTYPLAGSIKKGDSVKLEHRDLNYGFAKVFYTLDGTDPDETSNLYNPSTYQPSLLVPIKIEENTTIKVVVKGLGKLDSDIKTFTFTVQQ